MRQQFMPGEDPDTLPAPEDIAPLFLELCSPGCRRNGEWVSYPEWQAARPSLASGEGNA